MSTDFNKAKRHLKDALRELKKDEHDQLSSFYEEGFYSNEEMINRLIKDVGELHERYESPDHPFWKGDKYESTEDDEHS